MSCSGILINGRAGSRRRRRYVKMMQRLDVLDMVINQLREFEDRLDTQISTLELQIMALEAVVRENNKEMETK